MNLSIPPLVKTNMINPFAWYNHFGKSNYPDSWLISSRAWQARDIILCHLSVWWMGTARLAASTANLSRVAEGDKRLQWWRSFAMGDLGQQPPRRNRNWRLLARTPELVQELRPSIRGDTFLWSWQLNNWPAGRQGASNAGTRNAPIKYVMVCLTANFSMSLNCG